ncbi:MAG: hypothetical protein WC712_07170, partial [Candidatus Brocadiia bacterium]
MTSSRRVLLAPAVILAVFLLCLVSAFSEDIPQPQLPKAPAGATIYMRDSFMRERPEEGEWKQISGAWESDDAAKPGVSAHQFSMRGRAEKEALTVIGEQWWRDYAFAASLRTPPMYTSFGLVSCYRGQDEKCFFGFTAADGLVLEMTTGGRVFRLASARRFPIPYQWYWFALAIKGRKAWAVLDGKLVFEAELPVETCGRGGISAVGVMEYGVTVDDCSATSIQGSDAEVGAEAGRGFSKFFRDERLMLRRFPEEFATDRLMQKWASCAADWELYNPDGVDPGSISPEEALYSYTMPIYNDFSLSIGTALAGRVRILLMPNAAAPAKPRKVWELRMDSGNTLAVSLAGTTGAAIVEYPAPLPRTVRIHMAGDEIAVDADKVQTGSVTVPGQAAVLKEGARILICARGLEVAKASALFTYSDSILDETFCNAPANWLMVYGNWEVGSRWLCTPKWTYLASWDRMSSQLYSKAAFGGKVYCDVLVSPKMNSLRYPNYYPLRWFTLSFPRIPGDFSTGLSAVVGYPSQQDICLFYNGRQVAAGRAAFDLTPVTIHNTWIRLKLSRDRSGVDFHVSLIGAIDSTATPVLSARVPFDPVPSPIAIWNSLTGITVPRVRISAQEIHKGAVEVAYKPEVPRPCGVELDLRNERSATPLAFVAPNFDFSKGSAGWTIPANQPALTASSVTDDKGRAGVEISGPFCGSRLVFESPLMAVDVRLWKALRVRFRTTAGLAFYIRSGLKPFRFILKGTPQEHPTDNAIPIAPRMVSVVPDGKYTVATINLRDLFEECLAGAYQPVVDQLLFERFESLTAENLGVEKPDRKSFVVMNVEFLSDFPAVDAGPPLYSASLHPAETAHRLGLTMKEVRLTESQATAVFPPRELKTNASRNGPAAPVTRKEGLLAMSFSDSSHSLAPVGGPDECVIWRQKMEGEFCLTATKTGYDGFLGVKLLPEPVSLRDCTAMSVRLRGNTDLMSLLVKIGGVWRALALSSGGTEIKLAPSEKKSLGPATKRTSALLRITDGTVTWLLADFTAPEYEAGDAVLEDVFLVSNLKTAIPEATSVSVMSVIFYNPAKLWEAYGRGSASRSELQFMDRGDSLCTIRDLVFEKTVFAFTGKAAARKLPTSVALALAADMVVFEFGEFVNPETVEVRIGPCTFSGLDLRPGDSLSRLYIPRSLVYNDAAGPVNWSVTLDSGQERR